MPMARGRIRSSTVVSSDASRGRPTAASRGPGPGVSSTPSMPTDRSASNRARRRAARERKSSPAGRDRLAPTRVEGYPAPPRNIQTARAGAHSPSAEGPSWSPDGKPARIRADAVAAVLRVRRRRAQAPQLGDVIGSDGGDERRLGRGEAPAWSPDGTRIAFTRDGVVHVIDPNGRGERRIGRGDSVSRSPSGTQVLVDATPRIRTLPGRRRPPSGHRASTAARGRRIWPRRGLCECCPPVWQPDKTREPTRPQPTARSGRLGRRPLRFFDTRCPADDHAPAVARLVLIALVLAAALTASGAVGAPAATVTSVTDGDTLRLTNGQRIRLAPDRRARDAASATGRRLGRPSCDSLRSVRASRSRPTRGSTRSTATAGCSATSGAAPRT